MAEPDLDQHKPEPKAKANNKLPLFLVLTLATLLSVGAYFLYWQQRPDAPVPPVPLTTQPDSPTSTPETPFNTSETMPQEDAPIKQDTTLPTLPESDAFLRQHWQDMALPDITKAWLEGEFIIQRTVGFIDGLASGALLSRLTPLEKSTSLLPRSRFQATAGEGKAQLQLDQANFKRYTSFIEFLISVEPKHLAQLFHWLRPVLESAYGQLGQPTGLFFQQLITGLDLMLDTPDIDGPIQLKRESVYYQFADPGLEALPDSQKLLLRVGPENRKVVKQWISALKEALLVPNTPAQND